MKTRDEILEIARQQGAKHGGANVSIRTERRVQWTCSTSSTEDNSVPSNATAFPSLILEYRVEINGVAFGAPGDMLVERVPGKIHPEGIEFQYPAGIFADWLIANANAVEITQREAAGFGHYVRVFTDEPERELRYTIQTMSFPMTVLT